MVINCPVCESKLILSTYDVVTHLSVNVNNGETVEVVEGSKKLSKDMPEFYCVDCFHEWGS